jgi:hypothetical protein
MGSQPDFENMKNKYNLLETVQAVLTKLCFIYYPDKFTNFCAKSKIIYIMKNLI